MINIKADSRKVKPGDIFVALRGINSDGHDYIDVAIKNGASKLIVMDNGDYKIPYEKVEDTRKYLIDYLEKNYGCFINEMTLVGITGTNGKTTTAYLIYEALNKLDVKCGYIGTVGFYLEEGKIRNLSNTSPDIFDLYDMLVEAYDRGYRHMILEVSSQALVRDRFATLNFDYAVFTNLTQDHLDEHKTMENYAKAKQLLFKKIKKGGLGIVNFDDKYKDYFSFENNIYYGFKGGDYQITSASYDNQGTNFTYKHNDINFSIKSPFLGEYNIYNLLVAIIVLENMHLDINRIIDTIRTLTCPPGRMDIIKYGTNSIIVDYAHTPDAVLKILTTVNNINHKNIYTVFGCTGDRDRTKRPIMMQIVTKLSKYAIVTIDDPHTEDPMHVIGDMLENNFSSNFEVILDRGAAIEKGISLLDKDDVLLILGKGHEEFIIVGDKKIPFNDYKKVKEVISK